MTLPLTMEGLVVKIYDPETNKYIVKNLNLSFIVYQKKEQINKDEYGYLQLMDLIMKLKLNIFQIKNK